MPCRSAKPRNRNTQIAKKTSTGSTQERSVLSQVLSEPPLTVTPAFSKAAAAPGSTLAATKRLLPSSGCLNLPAMVVSVMVTESTLPSFTLCISSV